MFQVLYSMGARIDGVSIDGQTPLHMAAMCGRLDVVKWAVANNADLYIRDNAKRSPLKLAVQFHHKDVADFLGLQMKR